MYRNILFPVDISEPDSWTVSIGVLQEYVRLFRSKVHVLTVIPDMTESALAQYFPSEMDKKMREGVSEVLKAFTDKYLDEAIDFERIVAANRSIYQAILDTAKSVEADLIIMEAHRPGIADYLLGSNVEKVVRNSKTSVLVVRG